MRISLTGYSVACASLCLGLFVQGAGAKGIVSLVSNPNGTLNSFDCRSALNPLCYVGVATEGALAAVGNDHILEGGMTTAGVDIFDISNPAAPVLLLNWVPSDENCVTDYVNHCRTDIDELETEEDRLVAMFFSEGIEIVNGYGYFASSLSASPNIGGGVYVVDLTNPNSATFGKIVSHIVGPDDSPMKVHNLNVANIGGGTYLYMTGLTKRVSSIFYVLGEIYIYNVTDPTAPFLENVISLPTYDETNNSWVHDVKILRRTSGGSIDRVYLFCSVMGWNGALDPGTHEGMPDRVVVYDITDGSKGYNHPYDVYTVGQFDVGNRTHSVSLSPDGSLLYETEEPDYKSTQPYDLGYDTFCNTEAPATNLDGELGIPCRAAPNSTTLRTYALSWDYDGYEVTGSRLSSTLDDPGNFGINWTKTAHYSATSGNLLSVAWYRAGLKLFNMSDPANPVLVGSYDTYDDDNEFSSDYGLVADYVNFQGGLETLFLPNGMVALTDAKRGLFIFSLVAWIPPVVITPLLLQ